MAVDLTIQLFAHELFNSLWERVSDKRRPFLKIPESLNAESHITTEIVDAVSCRQLLFREVYSMQFKYTCIAYGNNSASFLAHICVAFDDTTFKELKVFERIIATCAFVMEMSIFCLANNNTYFLKDDFLCWAMYFDTELEREFYKMGGWKVLKSVAKSYVMPCFAIETLTTVSSNISFQLDKYAIGMNDYYYYQTFEDFGYQTCAKSWVSFRLRNGKHSRMNKFDYQTVGGLENFLTCFKFLCDPLGERILEVGVQKQNENLIAKCNENGCLKNIITTKFSKLGYPTNQNCNLQDGLEISPSPEIFRDQTGVEHDIAKRFQALEIRRQSNVHEPIDGALTTQKPMSPTKNVNEYFENFDMKFSKLGYPTKQNYNLQDGLEISPSPEIFGDQTGVEQDIVKRFQALEIRQQSNVDEPIGQALTTQKPTSKDINKYLENLDKKLSKLKSLKKQNCDLQDDLETIQSPEAFLAETDEGQALMKLLQASEIGQLPNGTEPTDQALMQNPTCKSNDLLRDSPANETNISSKNCITEEEYKNMWNQVMSTSICFDNLTKMNRIQAEKATANPRIQTQESDKLLKEDASIHENDDENDENINFNTGILQTYDLWKKKLNTNVYGMLNHVPVFISDHCIIQKKKLVGNKSCDVKENSKMKNETSQTRKAEILKERKVQNGKQSKKKKKAKSPIEDAKDILRMVFVLGCQPGVSYIRSTLYETCKTTSV